MTKRSTCCVGAGLLGERESREAVPFSVSDIAHRVPGSPEAGESW